MKLSEFISQVDFVATPDAEIVVYSKGMEIDIEYVERAVTHTKAPIRIVLKKN